MAQGIPVTVKMRSRIKSGGEQETFTQTYEGTFFQNQDGFYVLYEEAEETPTKTMIKWNEVTKEVSLVRRGGLNARMKFASNTTYDCEYAGPYGMLSLKTKTRQVQIITGALPQKFPIRIHMTYFILQDAVTVSENEVVVKLSLKA